MQISSVPKLVISRVVLVLVTVLLMVAENTDGNDGGDGHLDLGDHH